MSAIERIIDTGWRYPGMQQAALEELAALHAAVAERDAAIEKAVRDEREACAETAINCPLVKVDGKWLDRGTAIAIAIRSRSETVKP